MKCAICGIEIESTEQAIEEGWIPSVWDGDQEKEGPFCASCSDPLMQLDENGEFAVKEEYRGKITYQEGDFSEAEPQERLVIGVVVSERGEEKSH